MPRAKIYTRAELLATLEDQATRYACQSGTAHGLAQLAERALIAGDTEEARFLVRQIFLATHPRRGEDGLRETVERHQNDERGSEGPMGQSGEIGPPAASQEAGP